MTDIYVSNGDALATTQDENLPEQIVEEIRAKLDQAWHILTDLAATDPERVHPLWQTLTEVYDAAIVLRSEADSWRDTARSFAAVGLEMQTQRDAALDELATIVRQRPDRHQIARHISNELSISTDHAERILAILTGKSDWNGTAINRMSVNDLHDAIYQLDAEMEDEDEAALLAEQLEEEEDYE